MNRINHVCVTLKILCNRYRLSVTLPQQARSLGVLPTSVVTVCQSQCPMCLWALLFPWGLQAWKWRGCDWFNFLLWWNMSASWFLSFYLPEPLLRILSGHQTWLFESTLVCSFPYPSLWSTAQEHWLKSWIEDVQLGLCPDILGAPLFLSKINAALALPIFSQILVSVPPACPRCCQDV